jgi:hypothetical protein
MPSGGVNMKRTGITALMMAVSFPVVEKIKLQSTTRLNALLKSSSEVFP